MNVRRVILISGASVLGLVMLIVLSAFLAPGLLLDLMEVNSTRKRVAHCHMAQIARVVREHYLEQQKLPTRGEIADQLVARQSFRSCGQDPFTAGDALKDPWGDNFCLQQRSPSALLVFSKRDVTDGQISAALINAGVFRWEDIEAESSCQ